MGKVDDLRAMREARYAATHEVKPDVLRKGKPRKPAPLPEPADPVVATVVCGHRSLNGRTCGRPANHLEKNHRYA